MVVFKDFFKLCFYWAKSNTTACFWFTNIALTIILFIKKSTKVWKKCLRFIFLKFAHK